MRKVDDGEEKKKKEKEKKEKNGVFSGHYVIASSLLPERRLLERRTLVPIGIWKPNCTLVTIPSPFLNIGNLVIRL